MAPIQKKAPPRIMTNFLPPILATGFVKKVKKEPAVEGDWSASSFASWADYNITHRAVAAGLSRPGATAMLQSHKVTAWSIDNDVPG